MELVQPIRDPQLIKKIKEILLSKNEKYYIMFILGLNTGLRISDILQLKVCDFLDVTHLTIKEKKTGKNKRALINSQLQSEIKSYIAANKLQPDAYMIPSQKGVNQPITRVQAYRILKAAANEIGLEDIGSHSMRKTFGYWHYKQNKDVAILQDIFNHSSPSFTLRYIGINDDNKDETLKDFFI